MEDGIEDQYDLDEEQKEKWKKYHYQKRREVKQRNESIKRNKNRKKMRE